MALDGFKHFFVSPPPSDRMVVRGVGIAERMPPAIIDRPHGRDDWLFMLFYDPVTVRVDGIDQVLPPHTLMIWPPGRPQFYGSGAGNWKHTWIHCEGSHVRRLVKTLRLPVERPITPADPASGESHLLAIHAELTGHAQSDEAIVCNLLENWLRHVRRRIDQASIPRAATVPERFIDLRRYLEANYAKSVRLDALAARAGLSVPYLCATFKKHFGLAPIDYAIRLRLNHAVHLLADRNLSVTEIAARVGYEDLYHFSKLFKSHYGKSPKSMRDSFG